MSFACAVKLKPTPKNRSIQYAVRAASPAKCAMHVSHAERFQARSEIGWLDRTEKVGFPSPGPTISRTADSGSFPCARPDPLPAPPRSSRGGIPPDRRSLRPTSCAGSSTGRRTEKIAGDTPWRRSSTISSVTKCLRVNEGNR